MPSVSPQLTTGECQHEIESYLAQAMMYYRQQKDDVANIYVQNAMNLARETKTSIPLETITAIMDGKVENMVFAGEVIIEEVREQIIPLLEAVKTLNEVTQQIHQQIVDLIPQAQLAA